MTTSQERVFKLIRSFFSYHTKNLSDKVLSRVIHVLISIRKQYQMMMSSVDRVKFIKTKVTFRYHTKGVSDQGSSNSDQNIKSYSCSNSITKIGKNKKVQRNFLVYKRGNKGITNRDSF